MIVRSQDATQRYDEAVGEVYGLGSAERLCLSFLFGGPQTASAIARQVRLTPAAVTALIDRLETRGFVRRRPDPSDRRKVLVEMAEATARLAAEAELKLFAKFLSDSLAIQERMTQEFLARHGRAG